MMEYDAGMDDDVLAILTRNGHEVTFVTTTTAALDDSDFKVLMWQGRNVTIGIADDFLSRQMNDYVAESLAEADGNVIDINMISFMEEKLSEIMRSALQNVTDPHNSNLDNVLFRILEGF